MNYDVKETTRNFITQRWPEKASYFDIAWDILNKDISSDDSSIVNLSNSLAIAGLESDEVIEGMLKTMRYS